jgi:O-antigen ligase
MVAVKGTKALDAPRPRRHMVSIRLLTSSGVLAQATSFGPVLVLVLLVIAGFNQGGFWPPYAEVITGGSLCLLVYEIAIRRIDAKEVFVLLSLAGLAICWLCRAIEIGQASSFFPFGSSITAFAAAFVSIRPLAENGRRRIAYGLVGVGAMEAAGGFYGLTVRSFPLGNPGGGLWRLSSMLTYSNATGLLLGVTVLIGLGLDERRWYTRSLVCLCFAGLIATQSRGAALALACGCLLVPKARFWALGAPLAFGAVAGVFAVATSSAISPEPLVGLWVVVCAGAAAMIEPFPPPKWTRRKWFGIAIAACVVLTSVATLMRSEISHRFSHSALRDRNPEWSSALHQFTQAPWFGVGPDRIIPLIDGHGTFFHFAHNEYLQVAADAGVVGLTLLLVSGLAVVQTVRRFDVGASCAAGALVVFAVCGAVDFDWHLPMLGLVGGAVAGLAGYTKPEWPLGDQANIRASSALELSAS